MTYLTRPIARTAQSCEVHPMAIKVHRRRRIPVDKQETNLTRSDMVICNNTLRKSLTMLGKIICLQKKYTAIPTLQARS
jgi:hypothetical protein